LRNSVNGQRNLSFEGEKTNGTYLTGEKLYLEAYLKDFSPRVGPPEKGKYASSKKITNFTGGGVSSKKDINGGVGKVWPAQVKEKSTLRRNLAKGKGGEHPAGKGVPAPKTLKEGSGKISFLGEKNSSLLWKPPPVLRTLREEDYILLSKEKV